MSMTREIVIGWCILQKFYVCLLTFVVTTKQWGPDTTVTLHYAAFHQCLHRLQKQEMIFRDRKTSFEKNITVSLSIYKMLHLYFILNFYGEWHSFENS